MGGTELSKRLPNISPAGAIDLRPVNDPEIVLAISNRSALLDVLWEVGPGGVIVMVTRIVCAVPGCVFLVRAASAAGRQGQSGRYRK